MKHANRIRIMKILSLPDDVRGVVYTSDYTDYVRRVQKSAATKEKSEVLGTCRLPWHTVDPDMTIYYYIPGWDTFSAYKRTRKCFSLCFSRI